MLAQKAASPSERTSQRGVVEALPDTFRKKGK